MRSVLKFGTETGEILVSDPLFDVGVVDDEEDISPVTLTSRSRLSSSCDDLGRKIDMFIVPNRCHQIRCYVVMSNVHFYSSCKEELYLAMLVFLTEHGLPSLAIVVLSDSVDSLLNME